MADQAQPQELTPADRERAICTILWELAGRAVQAAKMTGDPRLAKIAAVASEQVKETGAFDALLVEYVASGATAANSAPKTGTQVAYQQAQLQMAQQNDQWNEILARQRESTAKTQAEIDRLTEIALKAMFERNYSNDRPASGEADQVAGSSTAQ